MSTKSSVIYVPSRKRHANHIYIETLTWNLEGGIWDSDIDMIKFVEGAIWVHFHESEMRNLFPQGMKLLFSDLVEFNIDSEGVGFEVKKDSATFKLIMSKERHM